MQYEKNDVGRYEDNVAEFLHKKAMTDSADEVGDTEENGFKAMLVALTDLDREEMDEAGHGYDGAVSAIVIEDDQGFVTVEVFRTDEDAAEAWEGYAGDAELGDGEERRDTVSMDKSDDDEEEADEEPVPVGADEEPTMESKVGPKFAAANGLDQFIISRQLPHRGVCSTCQKEGRMYQYGFRDRASGSITWHEEPFCNRDCMGSFYGMSESKKTKNKARAAPKYKFGDKDKYGVSWNIHDDERCQKCGQPDSCGDCNCMQLSKKDIKNLKGEALSPAAKRVALGCRLIEAGMPPGKALDKVLSGKVMSEADSLYMAIKTGDSISVTGPDGQKITGIAVKKTGDGWVLDVGDGAQGMATKDTVVAVDLPSAAPMGMDAGMGPEAGMGEPPVGAEPLPPEVGAPADLPPLEGSPEADMAPEGIGEVPEEPGLEGELEPEPEEEEEEELEF